MRTASWCVPTFATPNAHQSGQGRQAAPAAKLSRRLHMHCSSWACLMVSCDTSFTLFGPAARFQETSGLSILVRIALHVITGHGGAAVAQHCSETMLQHLQKNLRRAAEEGACAGSLHMSPPGPEQQAVVTAALKQSFQDCDEALTEEASAEGGSTAVCAIVGPTHLWVASCGA